MRDCCRVYRNCELSRLRCDPRINKWFHTTHSSETLTASDWCVKTRCKRDGRQSNCEIVSVWCFDSVNDQLLSVRLHVPSSKRNERQVVIPLSGQNIPSQLQPMLTNDTCTVSIRMYNSMRFVHILSHAMLCCVCFQMPWFSLQTCCQSQGFTQRSGVNWLTNNVVCLPFLPCYCPTKLS